MLTRTIGDIYHLKRVHTILPDHNLAATLADKIQRLNLKPALAILPFLRTSAESDDATPLASSTLSSSSPSTSLTTPRDGTRRGETGRPQLTLSFTTPAAAVMAKQVLPEPAALSQLLECIGYFELGRTPIAQDALALVRACMPAMTGAQLARTLAAACAIGQQESSVAALPLLTAALQRATAEGGAGTHAEARTVSPAAHASAEEHGVDIIRLMEALQAAGVHQEEVWSHVAEHCVRHMESLDGKELFRVIELLYLEDVRYYPDLFVAAEGYLSAQPYTFLSSEHREQLARYYRELGQPVVSLLAATSSSGRIEDRFDAALAALPSTATPHKHRFTHAAKQESPVKGSAALDVFVETACEAIAKADAQGLMELLRKCELRDAMEASVMNAAVARLAALAMGSQPSSSSAAGIEGQEGKETVPTTLHMDTVTLAQLLKQLFAFEDPGYFQTYPETVPTLAGLLNALSEHGFHELHTRLLPVALGAATLLLPPPSTPASASSASANAEALSPFFTATVRYLHEARDTLASESPNRLLHIVTILHRLPAQGGHAVLQQYLPFVSLAAARAPMRIQVEMASLLATLPAARAEVLPTLYRAIASQKGWEQRMQLTEARTLLETMLRSRAPDAELLNGVTVFVRRARPSMEPADTVWFLHSLALLGARDLEFFSSTAEHLLSAVSPVTRARSNVHDLCETLYVLTFVLKGVIRVVQQIMARLKVSAGQANPRDITLAFYSLVKLQVARPYDVTRPFCDRAVTILHEFKGEELASLLGSLRAMAFQHDGLMRATASLLWRERRLGDGGSLSVAKESNRPAVRLTDAQFVSVVTAMHHLIHTHAVGQQSLAKRNRASAASGSLSQTDGGGLAAPSLESPLALAGSASAEETTDQVLRKLFAEVAAAADAESGGSGAVNATDKAFRSAYATLCAEFRRVVVRLLQQATSGSPSQEAPLVHLSGVQVYLAITTLAGMRAHLNPPLSSAEWCLLATHADTRAEQLSWGFAEPQGVAAAEVLVALHDLEADAVPSLPSEEGGAFALCTATVSRWQATASPASALRTLPPGVVRVVQRHHSSLVGHSSALAGLKRTGLLARLVEADGARSGFDLGGATLSGSGKSLGTRKRRGRKSAPALTSESVMAAIDAEHTHLTGNEAISVASRAAYQSMGTRTSARVSTPIPTGSLAALDSNTAHTTATATAAALEEAEVWSPEVMLKSKTTATTPSPAAEESMPSPAASTSSLSTKQRKAKPAAAAVKQKAKKKKGPAKPVPDVEEFIL